MDHETEHEVGLTKQLVDWAVAALAEAQHAGEASAAQVYQQALAFLGAVTAALFPWMLLTCDLPGV